MIHTALLAMIMAASLDRRRPLEAFLTESLIFASYPSTPDEIASFTTCKRTVGIIYYSDIAYR